MLIGSATTHADPRDVFDRWLNIAVAKLPSRKRMGLQMSRVGIAARRPNRTPPTRICGALGEPRDTIRQRRKGGNYVQGHYLIERHASWSSAPPFMKLLKAPRRTPPLWWSAIPTSRVGLCSYPARVWRPNGCACGGAEKEMGRGEGGLRSRRRTRWR